jgi:hypothetical protein
MYAALGGSGCWPKYQVGYRPPEGQTAAERSFEMGWAAARETLQDRGFELSRQDRRAGVITTKAVVGQHFFEVWRRDATTLYSYGENSVQTILRAAKITFQPVEGSDKFAIDVKIAVARSDAEPQQFTDASQTMGLFGGVDTSRSEGREPSMLARLKYEDLLAPRDPADIPDAPVVPLGFDQRLEEILAADIREAAAGYIDEVARPAEFTDPGELMPTQSSGPPAPDVPNPALPSAPPPVPNPGGAPVDTSTGNDVEPRLAPATEQSAPSSDAPSQPEPQPLEEILREFEHPSPPSP